MDLNNILQEDYTYLLTESGENLYLESYLPLSINNFEFVGTPQGNTGIISVGEISR